MAKEELTILQLGVDTGEAVRNVADLQSNIKILKQELADETATAEDNARAAELLRKNQAALRDAMYESATSTETLVESSKKLVDENGKVNGSYNDLVRTMAELKTQWRATTDEAKRATLGEQIKNINDQLKEMDGSVGNFQRNVGNYQSAFKGLGESVDGFGKGMKALQGGTEGAKGALDAMGKTPVLVIIGLLVSSISKLVAKFKETEKGAETLEAGMVSLEPIMNFIHGIVDKLASLLANVIGKVGAFLGSNGLIGKIINGVVGVGNAIAQFVLTPFKAVAAAIAVFKEKGVKGIREATKAFGNEVKNGVSFKHNFQSGQDIAQTLVDGAKAKKAAAKEAGEEVGKEMGKGIEDGLKMSDWKKALTEGDNKLNAARQRELDDLKDLNAQIAAADKELTDEINGNLDEIWAKQAEDRKKSEENAKAKVDTYKQLASTTSSILGTIADLYEADEDNAEKNAGKIKALRIASALIDTISGAIGAYMQAVKSMPAPYGMIAGAANAAAVTAAGMAQIQTIKNTKVGDSSSETATSAVTTAPTINPRVSNVRSVTSASEEARLNQMASSQRVYILSSDIEASQNAIKVQTAEASF